MSCIQQLRFESLGFTHSNGHVTFQDLSFEFPMGKNVWITGSSGGGKSTLLKLLAGLLKPEAGSYFVNDFNVLDSSFEEFLPYRLKFGYASDYGGLLSNKTLYENLILPVDYHRSEEHELYQWADQLVEKFDLSPSKNERPSSVSGANRKATSLARAFVLRPEVLFLDHPTDGLNARRRKSLCEMILHGRAQGWLHHVFMTENDIEFARELSAHEIYVEDGQVSSSHFKEVA